MPFAWSSRNRLCPVRMVDVDYNEPKYEVAKYRRPRLRRLTKLDCVPYLRLPDRQMAYISPPGRLGEWPVFRYGRRKRSVPE